MKKHLWPGYSNIQEITSSAMLLNFDFRQVTTIFSVSITPAILAIFTFSKQMDINWDYIKDAQRDIYVKLTVEYRLPFCDKVGCI